MIFSAARKIAAAVKRIRIIEMNATSVRSVVAVNREKKMAAMMVRILRIVTEAPFLDLEMGSNASLWCSFWRSAIL